MEEKKKKAVFMGRGFEIERVNWDVSSSGDKNVSGKSLAKIKIKIRGLPEEHTAEEGVGPVDALSKALFKAIRKLRPEVDEIHLIEFNASYRNGQKNKAKKGTEASVMVSVDFVRNGRTFHAVETSENILEAAFRTLVRGIEALL